MNPIISVVIPIYKVEKYLRKCLESVIDQTYRNLEIILVDDGSPDGCGAICDEYASKDERIVVIHKENGGLSAARNTGIERATGDWLAFVDSDDWCERDYYEQMLGAMNGKDYDVFWSGGYYQEEENVTRSKRLVQEAFDSQDGTMSDELVSRVLRCGPPWDKLFKHSFLQSNGLRFDPEVKASEDAWFNFCVHNLAKNVGGCTYIGYHYRIVADSITKKYNPNKEDDEYFFLSKVYDYIDRHGGSEIVWQGVYCRTISLIARCLNCSYLHPSFSGSHTETVKQIRQMKNRQFFYNAIYDRNNSFLSPKMTVLKYLLRLRWIGPLQLAYAANEKAKSLHGYAKKIFGGGSYRTN